jgi:hypothetical protein
MKTKLLSSRGLVPLALVGSAVGVPFGFADFANEGFGCCATSDMQCLETCHDRANMALGACNDQLQANPNFDFAACRDQALFNRDACEASDWSNTGCAEWVCTVIAPEICCTDPDSPQCLAWWD